MSWRLAIASMGFVAVFAVDANAHGPAPLDVQPSSSIVEASPTLAPFQHVRFCLKYPGDCRSNSAQNLRIELDSSSTALLMRVNREVNRSIVASERHFVNNLEVGWTIAPETGDCNDYAVTKRHNLLENGLPSASLRLSVIQTASGVGHLVLVVATTRGDIVLDNLTDAIRPWQATDYRWVKIQSAVDPRFWNEVESPSNNASSPGVNREVRVARR
jgi:predicted transglutaminase-like cysteine proteinase